jgi:hypothetical protein
MAHYRKLSYGKCFVFTKCTLEARFIMYYLPHILLLTFPETGPICHVLSRS